MMIIITYIIRVSVLFGWTWYLTLLTQFQILRWRYVPHYLWRLGMLMLEKKFEPLNTGTLNVNYYLFQSICFMVIILDRKEISPRLTSRWEPSKHGGQEAGKVSLSPAAASPPSWRHELASPSLHHRTLFLKDKLLFLLPTHRHVSQPLYGSLLTLSSPRAH